MKQQNTVAPSALQAGLSREELEQHLRARAQKDNTFRQEFLANPQTVLQRDYAQCFPEGKIPSELSIKVIEEDEQTLCLVLPPKTPDEYRIKDIEMEEVLGVMGASSGGHSCNSTCVTSYCTNCQCNRLERIKGVSLLRL